MSTPSISNTTATTKAETGDAARVKERHVKHRKFDPWGVVAWIVGLGFFFPVFWMVLTAFKQEVDAYTTTPKFFFVPTLDEFKAVFDQGVGTGLLNSLFATTVSTILVLALGTPAAFALSLKPVRKTQDAQASIDGAPLWRTLREIVLPIISPGIAATALICVIFAWNEFFFAVNLTAVQAQTMPVFLVGFIAGEGLYWAKLCAAATMAALPVVLAGWVAQNKLVRGLSFGAIK